MTTAPMLETVSPSELPALRSPVGEAPIPDLEVSQVVVVIAPPDCAAIKAGMAIHSATEAINIFFIIRRL